MNAATYNWFYVTLTGGSGAIAMSEDFTKVVFPRAPAVDKDRQRLEATFAEHRGEQGPRLDPPLATQRREVA